MDFSNVLRNVRMQLDKCVDKIDIVLVAQVLGPRGHDNPQQLNCSETEHFTVCEFNEIYNGIVDAGFFLRQVFFSELEFIQDVVEKKEAYSNTVVFNLCRNGIGMNKKAVVPAICDLLGIRYTSSGSGQCAAARNKWMFTSILGANDIGVPMSGIGAKSIQGLIPASALVIGKPNNESASQGIDQSSIMPLEQASTRFSEDTLIQEYIDGYECEVPVFTYAGKCFAMEPVGISFEQGDTSGILSAHASQFDDYAFYNLKDVLPSDVCEAIKTDAERSFDLLGLQKYGRVDFRIDKDTHRRCVIDISTTPYITHHSSFAFAIEQTGFSYANIFHIILSAALGYQD